MPINQSDAIHHSRPFIDTVIHAPELVRATVDMYFQVIDL